MGMARAAAKLFWFFAPATSLLLAGCVHPSPRETFRRAAAARPSEAAYIPRVPVSPFRGPQGEYSAVSSVARFWGRPVSPADAESALVPAPGKRSSLVGRLELAALGWKLWVDPFKGSPEALRRRLRAGVPVLAWLYLPTPTALQQRWVVVLGVDERPRRWLLLDGRGAPVAYSDREFREAWTRRGEAAMTLCPPEAAGWELTAREHASRGRYYHSAREYAAAAQDYELALVEAPSNSAVRTQLGSVYRALERFPEAEAAFHRAAGDDPSNWRACNNLAFMLADQSNRLAEAAGWARRALWLNPGGAAVLDTLGYVLYRQGEDRQAAAVLERARGLARGESPVVRGEIALHLAWVYYRTGDWHLAREVLGDVVRENPSLALPAELLRIMDPTIRP